MCLLLKLSYANFGVFNLFFSKVIEEKSLGSRLDPPPPPFSKGRVNTPLERSLSLGNFATSQKACVIRSLFQYSQKPHGIGNDLARKRLSFKIFPVFFFVFF